MPKRRRERERSKTPEVHWETLPWDPESEADSAAQKSAQLEEEKRKAAAAVAAAAESQAQAATVAKAAHEGEDQKVAAEHERQAWRNLVIHLAMLRGHPEVEKLLAASHTELQRTAEACGATGQKTASLDQAKDAAKAWFARGLKGSNRHGPAERAALCRKLTEGLQRHVAALQRSPLDQVAGALERKASEEGPLVCCALAAELRGSRYEGLWISQAEPGIYFLGDSSAEGSGLPSSDADGATIYSPVRVIVKIRKDRLVIDAFYNQGDQGEMNQAGVPIGPFLSVYYEGMGLRDALAQWRPAADANGGEQRPRAAANGASSAASSIAAINATLPPGWELRESRSKKGVFYYANQAKGLSQMERPKA
eukprot:TRINITY_DN64719_c0_g1_i1.p1 TRINITY_DN64719_c0_g1~~TRINITY_DN64719_c0_g1_i1.p1  ORF type:complete len:367 (-),score=82.60 TRINITY_DN64719_c0_g1_i1:109-1209(-)